MVLKEDEEWTEEQQNDDDGSEQIGSNNYVNTSYLDSEKCIFIA